MPAGFTHDEAGALIDALAQARLARNDGCPFARFRDAVDDAGRRLSFVGRDALVARVEAMDPEEQRAVMRACARAISLRLAMPDHYRRDGEAWLRREVGPVHG
jgi:hypothetical protein